MRTVRGRGRNRGQGSYGHSEGNEKKARRARKDIFSFFRTVLGGTAFNLHLYFSSEALFTDLGVFVFFLGRRKLPKVCSALKYYAGSVSHTRVKGLIPPISYFDGLCG